MKKSGQRIAMLTAYDAGAAALAERAGAPVLLVGDSVGMVVHGYDTTLPVTLDMMVAHSAAVVRGSNEALVVADLPFLTYSEEATAVTSAWNSVFSSTMSTISSTAIATLRSPTV